MNDIATEFAPGPGHNNPPASIVDDLADRYKSLLDQFAEVKAAAESVPDEVNDDATQSKVAELIKKLRFVEKTLDGARELEREPHAKKVTEVNGFFKTRIEPLEKLRKRIGEVSDAYLKRKAAAEARRLQEEEDRRREAARVATERAQEAERTKNAASSAVNEYENQMNAARLARAEATSDVEKAQAAVAAAKADVLKVRAEIANQNATFAQRIQAGEEVTPSEKAEKRAEFEPKLAAAKAAVETAETELQEAKDTAKAAKAAQDKIDEDLRNAKKEVKTAERDVTQHLNEAVREEKRADKIADVVAGPEADLARTRSEHGAVSTLTRKWTSEIRNRDLLDKEALWPFINGEALEAALWKWMMAQAEDKRFMGGAIMQEETHGQTR